MNPIKKLWMYESWQQDQVEKNEFARSVSIFLGSFTNPEAAAKLVKDKKTYELSDDEFDQAAEELLEQIKIEEENKKVKKRRKRKVI